MAVRALLKRRSPPPFSLLTAHPATHLLRLPSSPISSRKHVLKAFLQVPLSRLGWSRRELSLRSAHYCWPDYQPHKVVFYHPDLRQRGCCQGLPECGQCVLVYALFGLAQLPPRVSQFKKSLASYHEPNAVVSVPLFAVSRFPQLSHVNRGLGGRS